MLERHSALQSATPYRGTGVTISESPDFALAQISGSEKDLKKALGKIPGVVGKAQDNLLRISPTQIWVVTDRHSRAGGNPSQSGASELDSRLRGNDGRNGTYVTELSSSRTRIAVEGPNARAVLAKLAFIDFHPRVFKLGMFVQTGI
ncbi:MAG: hypothetical protein KGO94_11870, partial [Alphaproteobacteria bacterium]|nr:hypothetical protein [Alphaproteobacteria bacterium]